MRSVRAVRGRRQQFAALVVLCVSVCVGCSEEESGDCSARIRIDGVVYRSHNELNAEAPVGAVIGTGEIIGCGTLEDAEAVDTVKVHAVEGVDHQVAVATSNSDWVGVYVAEGTPRSSWPAPLED